MENFITSNIKKLQVDHQEYIFDLIKSNASYSENSNGVFVKSSDIDKDVLLKIYTFMRKIETSNYDTLNNERQEVLRELNDKLSNIDLTENKLVVNNQNSQKKKVTKENLNSLDYNISDIEMKMKQHLKEIYPKNSIYFKIMKTLKDEKNRKKKLNNISRVGITSSSDIFEGYGARSITIDLDDVDEEDTDDILEVDQLSQEDDDENIQDESDSESEDENTEFRENDDEDEIDSEDDEDEIDEVTNKLEKMKLYLQQRGIKFNNNKNLQLEEYIV
jgi:hypothetical protein